MKIESDQITASDSLGRKKFGDEIASNIFNYLNENSESLVIGINGSWGSGKSTLLHFIKSEITEKFEKKSAWDFKVFEFNPWNFSGKNELHSIFLNEFASKVASSKVKLRALLRQFQIN